MLTVSRVAAVGITVGVAVGVDVGVSSGYGVAVFIGGNITTSVGVGGTDVGVGVGSACWHAEINPAINNDITAKAPIIETAFNLRSITESRIRTSSP